jgi:hypothetical protein
LDKFVEAMQMMAKMTDEEKMKGCPSYNDCAKEKGEVLYCSLGASPTCITKATVCICAGCPVTSKMGLKNQYFCTKGSEKEQRGM